MNKLKKGQVYRITEKEATPCRNSIFVVLKDCDVYPRNNLKSLVQLTHLNTNDCKQCFNFYKYCPAIIQGVLHDSTKEKLTDKLELIHDED